MKVCHDRAVQLDVETLRTYLAVIDEGGMTAAAKQLGQTQSAVSWRIKRLEQRVDRPLLIREGHSFRPSRDGRALIDDARTIVELHDRMVASLQSSELTGTVRVGANEEVGAARMAAVLGRFRRLHPGATIEFVVGNTDSLTRALERAELDVAVIQVNDDLLRPDDLLLWTDELRWVTCCETPYDEGEVPLLTFGDRCFYRAMSEPLLTAAGIDYNVAFSVPSTAGIVAAVEAGLGVAVIGERFLSGDIAEWSRGAALGPLPCVHQVARAVPGERPAVAAALMEAIELELAETGSPAVAVESV